MPVRSVDDSIGQLLSDIEAAGIPSEDLVLQRHLSALGCRLRLLADYPSAFDSMEEQHDFAGQYERRTEILRSAGLTQTIDGKAIHYPGSLLSG